MVYDSFLHLVASSVTASLLTETVLHGDSFVAAYKESLSQNCMAGFYITVSPRGNISQMTQTVPSFKERMS